MDQTANSGDCDKDSPGWEKAYLSNLLREMIASKDPDRRIGQSRKRGPLPKSELHAAAIALQVRALMRDGNTPEDASLELEEIIGLSSSYIQDC